MKSKHSKFKNTGLLFELMVRQIIADILDEQDNNKALNILKNNFTIKSEISRELSLYQMLLKERRFKDNERAKDFLNEVLSQRSRLNESKLRKEKYELVKSIKEAYDIDSMLKYKIDNYKQLASICKLFESCSGVDLPPADKVQSKYVILEHITSEPVESIEMFQDTMSEEDRDIQNLSYKILVDKFNEKYDSLNGNQKRLLREYMNTMTDNNSLYEYVSSEISSVGRVLKTLIPKLNNEIMSIKLNEIVNVMESQKKHKIITDKQIVPLMKYYEILDEVKRLVEN